MTKESRFHRRILSNVIIQAVSDFPEIADDYTRQVHLIPYEPHMCFYR